MNKTYTVESLILDLASIKLPQDSDIKRLVDVLARRIVMRQSIHLQPSRENFIRVAHMQHRKEISIANDRRNGKLS